jgi:hypothetical protein
MSNLKKGLVEPFKSKVVPARSKIAVNKSVISLSKRQSANLNKKKETGDDGEKLDEVFAETLEIAVALLPVVPYMCRFKYARNFKNKLKCLQCLTTYYFTYYPPFPRLDGRPKVDIEIVRTDSSKA